MMLSIYPLEKNIVISSEKVTVLEIKNPTFYSRITENLNNLCNKKETNLSISLFDDNSERMDVQKNVLLCFDLFNSNLIFKMFNKELYDKIKMEIQKDYQFQIRFLDMMSQVESFIVEESPMLDYGVQIAYQPNELDLFKLFKIEYDENQLGTILARMMKIVELTNQLQLKKLVVILNLRCFLTDEEWNKFIFFCSSLNVHVLCLEGETNLFENDSVNLSIIDEDLFEV